MALSREKPLTAPTTTVKNDREFNARRILASIGKSVKVVAFLRKQAIFAQGDAAGAVFYIQEGKVRLTVESKFGEEVTLSILSKGEFFGDGGLAGQPLRTDSAVAMTGCKLLQIENQAMMLELSTGRAFMDLFVAYLLARNIRYHEALVDHLFDPCKMRIARALLLLAHFGREGAPETVISEVSQETVAEMAGTTRLRVRFFMNRFRESGFLAYSRNGLQIHSSLLSVVLHNQLPRPNPASKAPRQ